jgi:hypothetical protein
VTGLPDDADRTNRERPASEVDAEFASIVSGISQEMSWSSTSEELDSTAATQEEATNTGDERERRRAQRRAQRAEEVAIFEAGQAQAQAELQADDAHFVPLEPPPLPKPKRRTVVALLFMVIGLVLLIRPSLLEAGPDVVLVLGIGSLIGGFAMLIHGLRPHASDPDDADGWDDGARL